LPCFHPHDPTMGQSFNTVAVVEVFIQAHLDSLRKKGLVEKIDKDNTWGFALN